MAKDTSVALGDHFARFVETLVAEGRYGSASEVVRAGLRLLEEREARLRPLRQSIRDGLESGPGTPLDAETFLARRGRSPGIEARLFLLLKLRTAADILYAVRIINKRTLDAFKVKHAIAEPNLVAWEQIVSQAEWTCWTDVRNHLGRRVDRVPLAGGVAFVFDLHGNDFRLIAGVVYAGKNAKGLPYQGEIYLKEFLTHAEYDEEDWKERFTA